MSAENEDEVVSHVFVLTDRDGDVAVGIICQDDMMEPSDNNDRPEEYMDFDDIASEHGIGLPFTVTHTVIKTRRPTLAEVEAHPTEIELPLAVEGDDTELESASA